MGIVGSQEVPKPKRRTSSKELYQIDRIESMPVPQYTQLMDIRTLIDAKIADRHINLTESQRMIYDILFL